MGSLEESKVWLLFAKDCGYLEIQTYQALFAKSDLLGSKIYKLYENWKTL
jgi:four helix bundle protein